MKKQLTFLVLCTITIMKTMAQGNATLVLWHADGRTTDVELYTQPQVLFQNDSVFVMSSVVDLKYADREILRFTYKGKGTGINTPKANVNYSQDGDCLVFHGITSTDKVALYTTNGIHVPVHLIVTGDGVTLSLASIPPGVYILNVNGKTSKITKK